MKHLFSKKAIVSRNDVEGYGCWKGSCILSCGGSCTGVCKNSCTVFCTSCSGSCVTAAAAGYAK